MNSTAIQDIISNIVHKIIAIIGAWLIQKRIS